MSHGSAITAKDWEKFKDVIHDLYIEKSLPLEGAGGVMAVMEAVHGFTRSKSQYVSQLKKWKFSKYSKDTDPRDWKVAGYKVSKARNRGRQVQLYLKGSLVTGKVLRTRGYLTSLDQLQLEGSSPRTPPDFRLEALSPAPLNTINIPFTNFWHDVKSFKLPSHSFWSAQSLDAVELTTKVNDLNNSARMQRAQSSMSLYIPASANSAIPHDLQHNDQHARIEQWWRFITYVLSNNHLTSLDHEDGHKLLRVLKEANIPRVLNSPPLSKKPTAKAFLETTFRLAIQAEDIETIVHQSPINPLQFALLSGNLPMAELLMHHNAKLDQPHTEWRSSAIVLAILGWRKRLEPRVVDEEDASSQRQEDVATITAFVRWLITNGAKVNTDDLGIHLRDHLDRFKSSLEARWLWLDYWQSPLIIAARYQLSELVGMFLDSAPDRHCPTPGDINSALGASLQHFAVCRFLSDGRPDMPQYPFAITSLLENKGADVTLDFDFGPPNRYLYLISSPLELLAYYTAWSSWAVDQKPTVSDLLNAMDQKDFKLCSQLLSRCSFSVCSEPTFSLVMERLRPGRSHWFFKSLDNMSNLDVQSMVLLQTLEFSAPRVRRELLKSPHCPAILLTVQPTALTANLIAPTLSTMKIKDLEIMYGENLQAFLRNISELGTGLIHMAIMRGNSSLATYLIHGGLNIDDVVEYGVVPETALCAAIRQGNNEMIDLLLGQGAKLEIDHGLCQCGHTLRINVLVPATEYGDADLIHRLVARGANPNAFGVSEEWHKARDNFNSRNTYKSGFERIPCSCSCVVPLAVCLLSTRNWLLFQALLAVGAHPIPTETVRGYDSHMTPLAALCFKRQKLKDITPFPNDTESFSDMAAQLLLDAGVSPLDPALAIANNAGGMSIPMLKTILGRILAQSTPSENTDDAETSALILAIKLTNPVLVNNFLGRGIATSAIDRCDKYPSPLSVALWEVFQASFRKQSYDIVYSLLEAGYGRHGSIRISEHEEMSLVHYAVSLGDGFLLSLLLDFGHRPLPRDYQESGCLASPYVLDMIKILFYYGIRPVDVVTRVKISAMSPFHEDAVAATALQVASALGYPKAAPFLIQDDGADVNAAGNETCGATALQFALMGKHLDIAQLLIDNGANVNAPPSSFNGATCLQFVASRGNLEWVKVLVQQHADVNAAPHPEIHPGGTALHLAVKNGSLDVARYLVDHDAQVNAPAHPHGGATALQYAAIYGFGAIVEYLLRHGADVHAKPAEKNGRTALEGAAENGRLDIVQILLDHEVGCREEDDHSGQRAIELAEAHGHFAIRDLIRGYLGGEEDVSMKEDLRFTPRAWSARLGPLLRHRRTFHDGKATFVTSNAKGSLQTRKLDIFIGDPHEAYVIVDTVVGFAMRSAIAKQTGLSLAEDADKVPLAFYHDGRHFAHDAAPYPRLILEQDLPRQNASNISPATFWLWGATHCVTLDGTPDHDFEQESRESHGRLEGAAEMLKDK
ncbi:hypothetical protein AK830_g4605 [Neonectria ditissima]|uniref:Clr5 domain-containing protein n=1 Tax=Neonectria ditissima TaxID=78410 RepID=A0A0N8H7J6_9HYPO|nr:hypothetical protein AK830_g4605 [Neonectria ditissima]